MGKTVTGDFQVVYDTHTEYLEGVSNLTSYEAEETNPPVTNKVLDEDNLTITYTVATTT